jgi:hypothetical protein
MSRHTGKQLMFHGGPLQSEWFHGASFFTRKLNDAMGYAGKLGCNPDAVMCCVIDWDTEIVATGDEELYPIGPDGIITSIEDAWIEQSRQIRIAMGQGNTCIAFDDGVAFFNPRRLNAVLLTAEQAEAADDRFFYDDMSPEDALRSVLAEVAEKAASPSA